MKREPILDLLIVGAGPTGIAIGAEARMAGLRTLLVDRGPLAANLLDFPTYMGFFTTKERLEVGGVPFAIPEDKPDRRQAIAYYQSVVRKFELDLALHEEVVESAKRGDNFEVVSRHESGDRQRHCRAIALATGYFHRPQRLSVPGEDLPWVSSRYQEPFRHYGEHVVVVGGGNGAVEAALELWRNGVHVTLVHRRSSVKESIKYWLRPDFEHRVEEGSIAVRYSSEVKEFAVDGVVLEGASGERELLPADAAYVLIGYLPDDELMRRFGIDVNPETLVPDVDPETCQSNVEGVYVAGTLQTGRRTDLVFIENSRDHGRRIVEHLRRKTSGHPPG